MHGPGSPPRGRGKVDGPPAQVGRGRITPAQAGRSPYFLYGKKDYKDHPRIGGEKAELTAAVISAMGSPPRRRGKGYREFGIDISDRITPAQAGKSVAPRQKRSALWDHPRVGGEKYSRPSYSRISMGSPPRGRGKGNQAFSWYGSSRITPAWAGKRFWNRPWVWATSDHPRMGGEKSFDQACTGVVEGSPPHGRGKDVRQVGAVCGRGITPAWAGKSKLALCTPSCPTDHPRAGREKNKELEGVWLPMGSPPRRRGKERSTALVGTPTRITPALAGKSYVFGPFRPGSWDHPRVGGEKQIGGDNGLDKQGSPPRGRGKGCLESFLATTVRITPAWAGKSMPGDGASGVKPDHPRVGGEKHGSRHNGFDGAGITPAWAGKSRFPQIRRVFLGDHPRVGGEKSCWQCP